MFKNISRHARYYLSVFLIIGLSVLLFYQTSSKELQATLVVLASVIYVLFGILHHIVEHDMSFKIVIEYALIGSMGLAVVLFLLRGGLG